MPRSPHSTGLVPGGQLGSTWQTPFDRSRSSPLGHLPEPLKCLSCHAHRYTHLSRDPCGSQTRKIFTMVPSQPAGPGQRDPRPVTALHVQLASR